jgi:hypothetical protein
LTVNYFRIGDISNRLVLESAKAKAKVPAGRVHKAVGRFVGKSARTVRYYAESAAFFDQHARIKYGFLPFSFFDFARNFGDQWEDVFKLAADNPGCTLGWLRANYLYDDPGEAIVEEEFLGDKLVSLKTRCAQNDLNDGNGKSAPDYSPLSSVGLSPTPGMTAAQFHFVQEVSYLLERARCALDIAKEDEDIPDNIVTSLSYHCKGLEDTLRVFAHLMDKPKIEQTVSSPTVDIVGQSVI